jgi:glycosyltransferase involved in cell wall biosynthesis
VKIHAVFITYNRLELTKPSIQSFLDTVSVPYTLIVVDNGSTDGTEQWLVEFANASKHQILLLGKNRYPGFACNRGWELAPPDADFLQRSDNDWIYLPGWCDHVAEAFGDPEVGQVGLRTDSEEVFPNGKTVPWNVGGNNVIRRSLWDRGLRYDERPWPELPAGHSEDTYLSPAVAEMGYKWVRVTQPCIERVPTVESKNDMYYRRSWGARRIYGLKPVPEDA